MRRPRRTAHREISPGRMWMPRAVCRHSGQPSTKGGWMMQKWQPRCMNFVMRRFGHGVHPNRGMDSNWIMKRSMMRCFRRWWSMMMTLMRNGSAWSTMVVMVRA